MRINILTPDSKMPNLAAMKLSTFHKQQGDEVTLNIPLMPADKTYASILFEWTHAPIADVLGGPGIDPSVRLSDDIEACKPDYTLYPDIDYSLGYTYRACHRGCSFCKVKDMNEPTDHRSIWTFHDPRFKKIALLNNNTFEDSLWRETFKEIWEADLIVKDHSGYDARLLDEEKARALARTRLDKDGQFHFAWDQMKDSSKVLAGLELAIKYGLKPKKIACYILIGYDTSEKEDVYRAETLREMKIDPFVMPYDKHDSYQQMFARYVNHKAIFKSVTWEDYKKRCAA
jgi:hypothetical protein